MAGKIFDIDSVICEPDVVVIDGSKYEVAVPTLRLSAQLMVLSESGLPWDEYAKKYVRLCVPTLPEGLLDNMHMDKFMALFNALVSGDLKGPSKAEESEVKNG